MVKQHSDEKKDYEDDQWIVKVGSIDPSIKLKMCSSLCECKIIKSSASIFFFLKNLNKHQQHSSYKRSSKNFQLIKRK